MRKFNPENERLKRAYFEYQKEAKKKSQATVDNIRYAITKYEAFTQCESFKRFNKDKAKDFKTHISLCKSSKSNDYLSKSTLLSTLRHITDFFVWLRQRQGYKKIKLYDLDYFNLSEKEIRIAQAKKRRPSPTIEQVKKIISSMPINNEIELRNRALIAFTLLTGIRDGATASLRLKHIKLGEELVEQMPPEVKTKFSKTIYTYFFPVGNDIKQIVIDWVNYLYKAKLFNQESSLFPRTKLILDKNNSFKADGIEPVCWNSANQIRKIFQEACEKAGLEYYAPHSFRSTLTRLGEAICKTPEEFKAWSQNLGHEQTLTTFNSYGTIPEYTQGEIIKNLTLDRKSKLDELSEKFDRFIKQQTRNKEDTA